MEAKLRHAVDKASDRIGPTKHQGDTKTAMTAQTTNP